MEYLYYYLPIIVMLLIQFIFAGQTLGTRIALLEGMSPRVFVVYRSAFATIVLAPFAYLSGYHFSLISFLLINYFLHYIYIIHLPSMSCLLINWFFFFNFFDRRNSGSYSLNLRSFSLIFLTSLIGFVSNL
jgi:hypothetical protein